MRLNKWYNISYRQHICNVGIGYGPWKEKLMKNKVLYGSQLAQSRDNNPALAFSCICSFLLVVKIAIVGVQLICQNHWKLGFHEEMHCNICQI